MRTSRLRWRRAVSAIRTHRSGGSCAGIARSPMASRIWFEGWVEPCHSADQAQQQHLKATDMIKFKKRPLADPPRRGLVWRVLHARHEITHQFEMGTPAALVLGVNDQRCLEAHLGEPALVGNRVIVTDVKNPPILKQIGERRSDRRLVAIGSVRTKAVEDSGLAHKVLSRRVRDYVPVEEDVPTTVYDPP